MKTVFEFTKGMLPEETTYCPGCTHGISHRLVMEVLEEKGLLGETIGVAPIGCSILAHQYMNIDMCESAHGRAPAVATGIRRVHPDKIVFTYQGDGDLASIGTGEIVHAAHRGEKFTTFFINNAIYGMTGGQMAPTSLLGQRTTTSVDGRKEESSGRPIRMAELIATIDGAVFVERVSLDSPANIRKAKKAIKKAIEIQEKRLGFGFVEILSSCPTNWGLSPTASLQWLRDNMIPYFPLGNLKCPEEVK
ncbi:thiamine pyrophosphate-dependent enzyme [Sinanaerobacter chloroacetimidivorans]|uniref:2-oxoglutarate oxidoreductase n=1 Tax=Sinanaerobacter chloroacetimidivorans TaxID=2818044 RepID=A0A8J7VX91_9FIRM|nr:thiamine pyrophosphate-dependent enzyme [Sinanaerobacter chloroacetimidivorans]MBR0596712.1 2-oxoglutarate oxidoreductase [Sinanaerobacter chloroacetimidivorans]